MMKKKSIQDRILLSQSGELSPRERSRLEEDLERDASGRAYRADLDALAAMSREPSSRPDVSEATVQHIHRAAADATHAAGSKRARRQVTSWTPALAYAAAALVLLATGAFLVQRLRVPGADEMAREQTPPSPAATEALSWDDPFDAEIEALDEMLAMVFAEDEEEGSASESLDDLAAELIELEGIEI